MKFLLHIILFHYFFIVFGFVSCQDDVEDSHAFCERHRNHRNLRDMYTNPDDCRTFIQCFFLANDHTVGFKRNCPIGTYWNSGILHCIPEADNPCSDPCSNPVVASHGCYAAAENCATFFVCLTGTSFPLCCSKDAAFNVDTCTCNSSTTCDDPCLTKVPRRAIPKAKPQPQNFGDYCIDSWGNQLRPTSDATIFEHVDPNNHHRVHRIQCAPESAFNLASCCCSEAVQIQHPPAFDKPCNVYLSFDNELHPETFNASAYGPGALLAMESGGIQIPAIVHGQRFPLSQRSTICFFFRCQNPPCEYSTTRAGLVSSRGAGTCGLYGGVLSFQPDDVIRLEFNCVSSPSPVVFEEYLPPLSDDAPSGFHQICIEEDGRNNGRFYADNKLLAEYPVNCKVAPPLCPLTIGDDPTYETFDGYIDEFLSCPFVIGPVGVDAHWRGPKAMAYAGLISHQPSA